MEKLAPDDASIKAALKLARPGPWSETGSTDTLVWGKCQGSGKTPYQVSVDLTGPAVKCSCPSRKFPCKHGLALLLLWVEGDGAVAEAGQVGSPSSARPEPLTNRLAISFAARAFSSGVMSAPPSILVIRTVPRAFGSLVIRLGALSPAPDFGRVA